MAEADPLDRVLFVDLSTRSSRVERRPDLFDARLGGAGVGIRLLDECCPPGADPLGPDNPVIFAVGALTSLFPLMSKTVALFKSPLTGDLGESHCGGRSAVAIRMAGYGAIVIQGRTEHPLYLAIHGDQVGFRDASALWGTRGTGTVGRVVREREPGAGLRSIMRIGRAGERGVAYASVTTETYRHFGRLGLGAVLGSKGLKAVVVSGRRELPVADSRAYNRLYRRVYQAAVDTSMMRKYHDLGTAVNVAPLNLLGALPVRNLQAAQDPEAERISGEAFAEGYLGRRLACAHCPIGCVHIAALREPYEHEAYFYKTSMISYDYELIYALGSMLGVTEPEGLLRLMDEVEVWGLDAMSTGVALAWATEALERGVVGADQVGLELTWGDWRTYALAMEHIVEQPTPLWAHLAKGVAHTARELGGEAFALTFGGNEMPGYHTGPAAHLGTLVGARHSHLCNGGYSLDQQALAAGESPTAEGLVDALIAEECWRQVLSSLVVCFFARKVYDAETISAALAVTGRVVDAEGLRALGEAIYRDKMRFKLREGFSFDDLSIPRRVLETPAPGGRVDEGLLREAIARVRDYHLG